MKHSKVYKICALKLIVGFLVLSYSLAYGAEPKAEQNNQNPPVPAWDIVKKKEHPIQVPMNFLNLIQ